MKCKAKVVYYKDLKKDGSKRIFTTLSPSVNITNFIKHIPPKKLEKLDVGKFYECQGKIVPHIGCHDEPTFGDHYAELDISFQCDTCKHNYYPQLPDSADKLNEWLNDLMENMK